MRARLEFLRLRRKYEVDESYWLVRRWRSLTDHVLHPLHQAALFLRWGRIPKTWELSFVARMRGFEEDRVTFNEVLLSTLPQFLGEDPSYVLRSWIGRKAMRRPDEFVRTVSKMFGASARSVLGNIESLVDEESLLEKKAPREPPYQSLLEAIQRSDASTEIAQPLHEPPRRRSYLG